MKFELSSNCSLLTYGLGAESSPAVYYFLNLHLISRLEISGERSLGRCGVLRSVCLGRTERSLYETVAIITTAPVYTSPLNPYRADETL